MNDCDQDAYDEYRRELQQEEEDRAVCYLQAARETGFAASPEELSRRFDEILFADFWQGVFFTEAELADDEAAALADIEAARGTRFWTEDDSEF